MPLIEIVGADPAMKKIRLKRHFASLSQEDKHGVVNFMEAGKTGEGAEEIDLTDQGREFVKSPDFIEAFNEQMKPKEPQGMEMMAPLISGLMQIIKQTARPVPHEAGKLNPEFQERVGGMRGTPQTGGFQNRLGQAFTSGGPMGLARAHRDLFTNDSGYKKFLREK